MKKPTPFGKYFLLERINVGGMAEVFRAKAFGVEGFERLVAVKRILSNIAEDKEFIRMFIEEAKLAVQLTHANIAQIFDLGVVDGSYYIALEHIHGRDLRGIFDRCRQLGEAMPVAQACFVAMKVCEGLDYAHNKRDPSGRELALVHRDVSPQNILVSFEGEVKLIDFGIAKAASTGPSTQAGILKGKFGYMSPEQVRGVQVDRRSDVFSCGIVLYELLTGERLFVGESDFSTLEKVRNVEILPPSTYNRKIPDELERIVLKALTKDVEDRYQNAIDLHDELQAFVYTAGEFYSRKDLAGWMKKTFTREIEQETAKLESFRQLKPPAMSEDGDPVAAVTGAISAPPLATPAGKQPRALTQPPLVVKPPRPPPRSQPMPMMPQPTAPHATPPGAASVHARPPAGGSARAHRPGPSSWDDDELETRVFQDDDYRHNSNRANVPIPSPVESSSGIAITPIELDDPTDLSPNLAHWSNERSSPREPEAVPGSGAARNGGSTAPPTFPAGSSNAPSPLPPEPRADVTERDVMPIIGREMSAPNRLVSVPYELAYDPISAPVVSPAFGARITAGRRPGESQRTVFLVVIGGAVLAAIVVIVVALAVGRSRTAPAPPPPVVKPAPVIAADPSTGFDLYVTPAGITQWKLDGESRTDRLPSRIRGISPGPHAVQIDPPPGFLSQHQQVTVELGKASRVDIALQPISGINGVFESSPPGATVSLIIDGKRKLIGRSPVKAPLDPRSSYQVLFEQPGYVSINRPITFSGGLEERVVANLEQVAVAPPPASATPPHPVPAPAPGRPREAPRAARPLDSPASETVAPGPAPGSSDRSGSAAEPKGQGVLVLGSKPPCEIAIDGIATGLHTPQKEIKLPAGRHRVTLTNSEYNIKDSFTIDIKADAPEKMIKDYSDQLPK